MAQQTITQEPVWNISIQKTFIVVQPEADAAKDARRRRSCPPLNSPSSKFTPDLSPSSKSVPACFETQPANQVPPCKSVTRGFNWADSCDQLAVDHSAAGERAPTTMMIRNIPCCCSKEDVIGDIDGMGFAGSYDFFYLPRHRKSNLGYAFINFTASEMALDFRVRMQGHRFSSRTQFGGSNSRKACTITPAVVQGLTANKKHFRRTRVIKSERGPTFFQEPAAAGHALGQQEEVPLFQKQQKHMTFHQKDNKFDADPYYSNMVDFQNMDALYGA